MRATRGSPERARGAPHQDGDQIVIAGNMIGMCEAVQHARNAGLDPATVLQSIGGGAAASWTLSNLCSPAKWVAL